MIFFKEKSALEKLQKHEYKDHEEKKALLEELKGEKHPSKEGLWMLTDSDGQLRDVGALIVFQDISRTMLETLVQEMKSKGALGKRYILPLLTRYPHAILFPFLQKQISSPAPEERKLAVEIVSQYPHFERFLTILTDAMKDPEEEIRFLAVNKLSVLTQKKDFFLLLLPFLYDHSDRIRHKVIQELSKTDSPELVEHFFARLALETKEVQDKMIATLSRLARNPELKIEERIIPELASESALSREVSARLLAQMPNKVEVIRKFLVYTRGIVFWLRERIFETMHTIAGSVADAVLELLMDEDPAIRIDSMFLAAYIQDRRIIPGVIKLFESDMDWWVKVCAIDVLVKLKAPDAPELLKKYEQDPDLKWGIISAYGELGDPSGVHFLMKNLQDKSRYIRLESLRALAKFKGSQTIELLKQTAENALDSALRYEAVKLLEELGTIVQIVLPETKLDKPTVMAELKAMGIEMESDDSAPESEEAQGIPGKEVIRPFSSNEEKDRNAETGKRKVTVNFSKADLVKPREEEKNLSAPIVPEEPPLKAKGTEEEKKKITLSFTKPLNPVENVKQDVFPALENERNVFPQEAPPAPKNETENGGELTQEEMLKLFRQKMEKKKLRDV